MKEDAKLQLHEISKVNTSLGYDSELELAYNTSSYTEGSITEVGWDDLVEVFEQRMREQPSSISNRYELFFEAQHGGGSFSTLIDSVNPGFLQFMSSVSDDMRGRLVSFLSALRNQTPSISDYTAHQSLIDEALDKGQKLLLFSHSQGALFANQADRYIQQRTSVDRVRAVYAAPASPEVFGAYTLADNDLVINYGLRALGPVVDWNVQIPGYEARAPGIILRPNNGDGRDFLGHGLMEIYLNPKLATYNKITNNLRRAFDDLSITPNSMKVFEISFSWSGGGNVDFTVDEPNHPAGIPGQIGTTVAGAGSPATYSMPCASPEPVAGRYMITYRTTSSIPGRRAELTVRSGGKLLGGLGFVLPSIATSVTIASVRVQSTDIPGVYKVAIF